MENWSFSGLGINVYPKSNFSIWPGSASSHLLAQKLLICKQTVNAWLNIRSDLENSYELFDALSMMLSYRLVSEFEDFDYASVVVCLNFFFYFHFFKFKIEEMVKLSSLNENSSQIKKYTSRELAAILLMVDDALGREVFDYAMSLFIEIIQKQKDGNAISILIESFQQVNIYSLFSYFMI